MPGKRAEILFHYFPEISSKLKDQFEALYDLYLFWNNQINVISRKDFDAFYERHVLHSLGIAKVIQFKKNSRILDVGTGGGFPGIPLAVFFPDSNFVLVDSIGKKIKVVNEIATALEIKNVTAIHSRAEMIEGEFDFVVSRAVTQMKDFIPWVNNKFSHQQNNAFKNGILYLKGGDLTEELNGIKHPIKIFDLKNYFEEEFFETKKVVYVQMT